MYRFNDKPPKPEDHLKRFDVRNGAIMRIAFGCYYSNIHDRDLHDHIGWPNPERVDNICQLAVERPWFLRKNDKRVVEFEPIHLIEEGYTQAIVSYEDEDNAQHLTTEAWIDEDDDNIVKMKVHANFETFSDKPIDTRFTIFVKKEDGSAIDAVCHGMITVLPGSPCPAE